MKKIKDICFSMGDRKNLYIKETKEKGKSIFTNKHYKKDDFIFLIAGSIITKGTKYTIPIAVDLYIDPVPVDNFGRYLCHSCNPNAGIKKCRNKKQDDSNRIQRY